MNSTRTIFALAILALTGLAAAFFSAGCNEKDIARATQIAQGGMLVVQSQTMNEEDEFQMGRSVTIMATNNYPLVTNKNSEKDEELSDYVTLVGLTVSTASPRADYKYVFGVLDTDEIGAYSGPSGYVMITRGLIQMMRDEAELAGVLAHEVAHVANQHGLKAVKQSKLQQGLMMAITAGANAQKWTEGVTAFNEVIFKSGYSQPQEFEADAEAVKYLVACRYDPNSYLNLLKRLAVRTQDANMGSLTSTHPGLSTRIEKVSSQIGGFGITGGAKLPDRFMKSTAMLPRAPMAR